MFAFIRLNRALQHNVYVSKGIETHDAAQSFIEIQITWNSQKLDRKLWKTKKFYDSRTVANFGDTALGKAMGYCNKLLQGRWLTDEEYNAFYQGLLNTQFSPEHKVHASLTYPQEALILCMDETAEQYKNYTAFDIDRMRKQLLREQPYRETPTAKWELLPYDWSLVWNAEETKRILNTPLF